MRHWVPASGSLNRQRPARPEWNSLTVGAFSGSGTIDNVTAGGGVTLTVGSGGGSGVFSGTLQNTTGTIALMKAGNGTQTLSGANTYLGTTTVNGGTLLAANTAALPSWQNAGTITVSGAGSTLALQGGTAAGEFSPANISTVLSNVTFPAGTNLGIQVVDPAPFALTNSIGGVQGLVELGGGVLVLSASNGYTGGTTVSAGTLELGNANAASSSTVTLPAGTNNLTFGSSGATYNIGSLAGAGSMSLTAVSGGSVTLSVGGNNAATSIPASSAAPAG